MKSYLLTIVVLFFANNVKSQNTDSITITQSYVNNDGSVYSYAKPKFFEFITHIPTNYSLLAKETVKKQNIKWLGLTTIATLAFLPFDEQLITETQKVGTAFGISQQHQHGELLGGALIYPTNSAAAFYYLGHGNPSLLLSAGLVSYGAIKKDYRAMHTASEIVEGILTLGVMTQGLKRVFGRQSPTKATVSGGEWNFFPGIKQYFNNIPNYDAMPSGHMATLVSTITIISKNYPDKKWIKPVGYSAAGLLALEMMNSEVHWFTDYPLGFLIGYGVGTVVANRRIKKDNSHKLEKSSIFKSPELIFTNLAGTNLIGAKFSF